MNPGSESMAAPLTERWWWLAWDRETDRRHHLLTNLDGAAVALEEVICGRAVPEHILFVRMQPPQTPTTSPEEVADEVRAAISRCAVDDARTAALIWLFKYAQVGTPTPMARLYPDRRVRREAKRALMHLRPRLSTLLPPDVARAAYAVLEVIEPRAAGVA